MLRIGNLDGLGGVGLDGLGARLFGAGGPSLLLPFQSDLLPTQGSASPTFSRASGQDYINAGRLQAQVASGVAAFDYAGQATPGVLIEAAGTNLLLWSHDYTQAAAWTPGRTVPTSGVTTGPDGVANSASNIIETTANSSHNLFQSVSVVSGTQYCGAWKVKYSGRQWLRLSLWSSGTAVKYASFDVLNGVWGTVDAGVTKTLIPLGGGWYWVAIGITASATGTGFFQIETTLTDGSGTPATFSGDASKGFSLDQCQMESGTLTPTSYMPSTVTRGTRAACSLSYGYQLPVPGSVSVWFRPTWPASDNTQRCIVDCRVGSSQDRLEIYTPGSGVLRADLYGDAVGPLYRASITIPSAGWQNNWHHVAAVWDSSGSTLRLYLDGVSAGAPSLFSGAWGGLTALGTTLYVGVFNPNAGTGWIGADLSYLRIYPRVLSAGEVSNLYNSGVPN